MMRVRFSEFEMRFENAREIFPGCERTEELSREMRRGKRRRCARALVPRALPTPRLARGCTHAHGNTRTQARANTQTRTRTLTHTHTHTRAHPHARARAHKHTHRRLMTRRCGSYT